MFEKKFKRYEKKLQQNTYARLQVLEEEDRAVSYAMFMDYAYFNPFLHLVSVKKINIFLNKGKNC